MTIRPKIKSLIDLLFLFSHDHLTKIYDPLSFILSLRTTIRPKIRVFINLFAHDHSTKARGHSYPFIYSFLNCLNISFAIFMAVLPLYFVRLFLAVVSLYFVHYINSSTAFIFCTLYSWKCCSYISYAIFIAL